MPNHHDSRPVVLVRRFVSTTGGGSCSGNRRIKKIYQDVYVRSTPGETREKAEQRVMPWFAQGDADIVLYCVAWSGEMRAAPACLQDDRSIIDALQSIGSHRR